MTHIGIDARLYGVESGTGIGRYTEQLIQATSHHLSPRPPRKRERCGQASHSPSPRGRGEGEDISFTVFLRKDGFAAFELPDGRWRKILADFRPYSMAAQVGFPGVIRRAGVDLMHFTHFDHPLVYRAPFVVTIHDLILLSHPSVRASTLGPLRFWGKYAAYRHVIEHAIHASMRILTPSRAVKEDVAGRFGVLREKIVPTLLGVDHASQRGISNIQYPISIAQQIPKGAHVGNWVLGIGNSPYLLYIGNCYPHKHVEQLIRVMPTLREQHPNLHLVMVGREDDFQKRLNTKSDRTGIVFTGAVTDAECAALFTGAAAYVSASAAEGFDIPTVEALAAGVPVIASDIPVHREVLGECATYFPVGDDHALRNVIHRMLTSADRSTPATMERKRHAEQYAWRVCAAQTLAIYRETLTLRAQQSGSHVTKDHHARQEAGADVRET